MQVHNTVCRRHTLNTILQVHSVVVAAHDPYCNQVNSGGWQIKLNFLRIIEKIIAGAYFIYFPQLVSYCYVLVNSVTSLMLLFSFIDTITS